MAEARRTDRAERLLDLVSLLLAAKGPVTWDELQDAFPGDYGGPSEEANLRKWERDKAELLELGVPLSWIPGEDERPSGYLVDRSAYYLKDLALSPEERALLGLAGAAALSQPGFPFRRDLAHALDKLLFAEDPRSRSPGAERGPVVHLPAPGSGDKSQLLETLGRAVASRKDVTIEYRSFAGEATTRRVSPYGLAYRRGAWFFVGHCHLRGGLRTFQVERVRNLAINEAKPRHPDFDVPEGFSVREHVAREPWQYVVHAPLSVELRLDREVALLAGPRFGAGAELQPEADGGVLVRLTSTNGEAVIREVLALSPHAELRSPPELRERLLSAARRVAEGHAGEGGS